MFCVITLESQLNQNKTSQTNQNKKKRQNIAGSHKTRSEDQEHLAK